jgi:hypothetical protein
MKPFILATFILLMLPALGADNTTTAKILSVKAYEQGRIAFWEGRSPVYDGYPFYDITLTLDQNEQQQNHQKKDPNNNPNNDQKKYVVRYESMTGYFPAAWQAGREIRVRLAGKGKMFLLNGEEEVMAQIYNGHLQDCVPSSGRPTVTGPGPQVPCD